MDSGYEALMNWDGTMIKKVGHRRPNYEALYVLWSLKAFEVIVFETISFLENLFMAAVTVLSLLFMRVSTKPPEEMMVSVATHTAHHEAN